ncbi:phosphotransferase [Kribbella sp. NPDC051620]|uniref:phosphotransferase n=1 Tax=Kribbella sp. NPDC051620 TaxID=3364120 RepID=UPI0037A3B0AE
MPGDQALSRTADRGRSRLREHGTAPPHEQGLDGTGAGGRADPVRRPAVGGDPVRDQRQGFFQACDLEAMGAFQDWDRGVVALRAERPDLADWAEAAMAEAEQLVAESNLSTLPQSVVHGDFAEWNLHFTDDRLTGIIDFDLVHPDSRAWEFVIARVHRSPGLLTGYQRTATELGIPLTERELAAIDPLQRVFRVNMVMAELWSGPRTGRFDVPMIERQLARTGTAKP